MNRPPPVAAALAFLVAAATLAAGCGSSPAKSATQGGASTTDTGGSGGTAGAGGTAGSGGTAGAGGSSTTTPTSTGPVDFCTGCALQSGCLALANTAIDEASGLAASALHDGAFYLHNDSGDSPRFFAANCPGDDLGTYSITGAAAVDWEDMARGPCDPALPPGPTNSCLFFADIGDNAFVRTDYVLYRTPEPTRLGPGPHQVTADKLPFAYPDGSHNAETLLVHPLTGEIAIVTKVDRGPSAVYAFPLPLTPGRVATLTKVAELTPPLGSNRFTAGDVHPQATGILLRTYTSLFHYPMTPSQTLGAALSAAPCEVPVMLELQGESVTFTAAGTGYVTVSEMTGQSLHLAACQ